MKRIAASTAMLVIGCYFKLANKKIRLKIRGGGSNYEQKVQISQLFNKFKTNVRELYTVCLKLLYRCKENFVCWWNIIIHHFVAQQCSWNDSTDNLRKREIFYLMNVSDELNASKLNENNNDENDVFRNLIIKPV